MKPHILLVGSALNSLLEYLKFHEFDYTVLKDKSIAKNREKKRPHRVVCDFSSQQTMLAAVDGAARDQKFDGLMTTYERYVLSAAGIAYHLGLPGMPIEAAQACTDKFLMRQKFALAPSKISPNFAIVNNEGDLRDFASKYDFPLILKPAHLAKSLLVTKSGSLDELLQNYQRTFKNIDAIYAKYAPGITPKLLVEEFLQGPVHSVDAFVDSDGAPHILQGAVDYQTGYDIGFEDNFHYSRLLPSALSDEEVEKIREVAAIGCRALGMKNSPAHVEIIRTSDGPRIVEIGARNGGYRSTMHRLANGIDITGNALKIACGLRPEIAATKNDSVGVFELFPKTPGEFVGIQHEADLRNLPSFVQLSPHAIQGDIAGKSSDGYKTCAVVTMHHADPNQFKRDVEFLDTKVRIITK